MPRTRLRLTLALACVLTICCGTLAWAGWTASAHGSAGSRTAQVPAPAAPEATPVSRGADVSWSAVEVSGQPASGYEVFRRHQTTGTTVPATGGCAGVVTTTSCRDAAVEPGTWTFTVRALLGGWTGVASTPSNAVEVDGSVEASLDVTPRAAVPGAAITVTGAGWAADEEVRVEVGGTTMCRVTAADDGDLSDTCALPGRPHGSHAVRAVGSVTVVESGSVAVQAGLREVSPTVTAGARVAFRPRGFAAGAQLQVRLGTQALGTVTTGSDGEAALTRLDVPATMPEGDHQLVVTDPAGNSATASVTVTSASVAITPAAAAPGAQVQVTGAGWPEAAQQVQLTLGSTSLCNLTPDGSGAIAGTCTVPDALGGPAQLRASNGVAVAQRAFEVLATVSTSTPSTSAGSTLGLTGRGFGGSGQPATIAIDGQPVTPTSTPTVNASGRVTADIVVPELSSGPHTVRITDATGRSASTTVDVTAPELELSTSSGTTGEVFQVSGAHWPASVQVTLFFNGSQQCTFQVRDDGAFGPTNCTVPTFAGGAYDIRVAGGGASLTLPAGFTILPRLTLAPARATAGQSVSASASGLAAASDVVLTVGGTQVATGRTGANGRITDLTYTVPDLPVGVHTVRVTDSASGTATAELMVFAPDLTFSTRSGSVDDTFQVSGANWPASTQVVLYLNGSQQCSTTTRADGSFAPMSCSVQTLPRGTYPVRVTGGGTSVTLPDGFTVLSKVILSPTRATSGQSATVAATGLAVSSAVVVTVDGTEVATGQTTSTGRLNATTYTVPDLPAGPHVVRVADAAGGSATAELTVFAPDVTLSTTTGGVDDVFQVSGANWPAAASVTIFFNASQQCSAATRADGSFGPTNCSVPTVPGGKHTIRVTGGGASLTFADAFTVVGRVSLNPARVTAGQGASLTASGLAASSDVVVSVDGTQVATARTASNGRLGSTTYTVPAGLAPGAHELRVSDASGGTASADLTVFAPEVTLSKSSGVPDEQMQVSGQHWPPSVSVVLNFGSSQPCSFTTRADGTFGPATCFVPYVPGGDYVIRATSSGLVHTLPATFRVLGHVSATPDRVAPGQQLFVAANGLAASSDVTITLGDATLGTARTGSTGRLASTSFPAPALPPGPNTLRVADAAGGSATTTVTIHAVTLQVPTSAGSPQSAFPVSGQGWPAGASVDVKVGSTTACTVRADASGDLATSSCTVPNLAGRTYDVVASGGGPLITLPAAFTITPRVAVTQEDASPGQQVTLSGHGLPASSDVTFTIGGVAVGTARTSTSGATTLQTVTVPDLPAGPTGVRVTGTAGASPEAPLLIRRPTLQVEPAHRAGETLRVTGTGWRANATIALWFGGSNFCSVTSGSTGALDTQCSSTNLPGGQSQELSGVAGSVRAATTLTVLSSLRISSSTVQAGSLFNFTGRGLLRDRDAQVVIGGTVVATFRPGSLGDWTGSARMPAGTTPGQVQVVLRQEGAEDATATITVT